MAHWTDGPAIVTGTQAPDSSELLEAVMGYAPPAPTETVDQEAARLWAAISRNTAQPSE